MSSLDPFLTELSNLSRPTSYGISDIAATQPVLGSGGLGAAVGGGGIGPFSGAGPFTGAAPLNVVTDAGAGGLGAAAGGAGGLGYLGTAARIAGYGTKAGMADMSLTGLPAMGYRLLPLGVGIGTGMLADRAAKAAGINHNSLGSDIGEGALGGAAAGATAGLLGGPFAEISVPVGAAVGTLGGAVVGGVGHLLSGGGGKSSGPNYGREGTNILNQVQQAGLDPQTASDIYNQYGIYLRSQLASSRGTGQEQATRQDAYQKLATNLMGALQTQKLQQQGGLGGLGSYQTPTADQLALNQALIGAYVKPYTDQSLATSAEQQSILNGLADKIGGPTANTIRAQAEAASGASQRTALAYATQAQLAPQTYAWEQQMKQFQSLAAQLQQYAIQNYLTNGATQGAAGYTPDWGSSGAGLSAALGGGVPSAASTTNPITGKKTKK